MLMRIFKVRAFQRWMRKTELTNNLLCDAVEEMTRGLIDAELGGGVVKKRIALPHRGKSGSTRTIVATNHDDKWFFLFGFEKSDRENITNEELNTLRLSAQELLMLSPAQLETQILTNVLEEINYG